MQLHNDINNIKLGTVIRQISHSQKEKRARFSETQIEKLKTAGTALLAVIGAVAAIGLAATVPNALGLIAKILHKRHPNRDFGKREKELKLAQTFYYLKRSGFIIMKPRGRDIKIWLTKKGRHRLKKLEFETLAIVRPNKWDGRWWQVAADIPTKKYKIAADLFRRKLKQMQFFSLQRTLWLYPFDPRLEIEFITQHYGIARFVTVMEISRLDWQDETYISRFFRKEKLIPE